MKKFTYFIAGGLSIAIIILFVWIYGDESTPAQAHSQPFIPSNGDGVKGSLVSLEQSVKEIRLQTNGVVMSIPLAKSVWVYRNLQKAGMQDLKPNDWLEIILNSSNQAAYIKATSNEHAAESTMPTQSPTNTSSSTITPAIKEPIPSPSAKDKDKDKKQGKANKHGLRDKDDRDNKENDDD